MAPHRAPGTEADTPLYLPYLDIRSTGRPVPAARAGDLRGAPEKRYRERTQGPSPLAPHLRRRLPSLNRAPCRAIFCFLSLSLSAALCRAGIRSDGLRVGAVRRALGRRQAQVRVFGLHAPRAAGLTVRRPPKPLISLLARLSDATVAAATTTQSPVHRMDVARHAQYVHCFPARRSHHVSPPHQLSRKSTERLDAPPPQRAGLRRPGAGRGAACSRPGCSAPRSFRRRPVYLPLYNATTVVGRSTRRAPDEASAPDRRRIIRDVGGTYAAASRVSREPEGGGTGATERGCPRDAGLRRMR